MQGMSSFPININLVGRQIVVIGGSGVAEWKIHKLLEAGAQVIVIAPRLSENLIKLRDDGFIRHLERCYIDGDLKGKFLAISATNDKNVNIAVAREAKLNSILADICDNPELSSFTMPAVMTRGDLSIAVSTGGKSPAMAKKIRENLEELFGPEYALVIKLFGILREKLLTPQADNAYNKKLLSRLASHDLPRLIRERQYDKLDQIILSIFGFELSSRNLLALSEKDLK